MASDLGFEVSIDGLSTSIKGVDALTKSIDNFANSTKSADKSMGKMEGSLSSIAGSMKNFYVAAIAAGGALLGFLGGKEAISAAIEKEDAINRLSFSLANGQKNIAGATDELTNFADEIERTTRFTDDQAISTVTLFRNINQLDKDGLKKATTASANLATVLGTDLDSASMLVSKALEGNVTALSRYGINIKKGATDTETFNNTMNALSKFAGAAQNDMNSFGGATVRLRNSIADTAEEFGNLIVKNPVFTEVINRITSVFGTFTKYLQDNQTEIIQTINSIIKGFGKALKGISPLFDFLLGSFNNLAGIIRLSIQGFIDLFKVLEGFDAVNKTLQFFTSLLIEIPKGILLIIQLFSDLANSSTVISTAFKKAGIDFGNISAELQTGIDKLEDFQVKVADTDLIGGFVEGLEFGDDMLGKFQEIVRNQKGLAKAAGEEIIKLAQLTIEKQKKIIAGGDDKPILPMTFFQRVGEFFTDINSALGKASLALNAIDDTSKLDKLTEVINGLGPSLIGSIAKGKAGATQIFSSIASGIGNAILPGLGSAVAPFIELFAQGPEAVRKTIREFVQAIPDIIENVVVYGIPALIDGVIDALPSLIEKTTQMFLSKLSNPIFWTTVAMNAAAAFIDSIPQIVQSIIDGIKNGIGNIFSGGGGNSGIPIVGGLFDAVGGLFAKGGTYKVPGGYPNDQYPAYLTSNELVIDRSLTMQLEDYLEGREMTDGDSSGVTNVLLSKVINLLERPMEVNTSVQVNQKTFADIIVNLNRINARLA